jgi:2,4-dienoyl-CoA reductase (NADPH2)
MAARWNRRTDGYGGPFKNRMRLAREILDVLRDVVGPDRLLGVTLSAGLEEYVDAAAHLAEHCDVDYVAIGNGSYAAPHLIIPPMGTPLGMGVALAAPVKERLPGVAVVAEGRINQPALGEQALQGGSCDLVGMTRAMIADPEMPAKAARGELETIRPCIGDNLCIARRIRKFPIACLQNPAAGFEAAHPVPAGRVRRRVVVVGGGVAGLEAARRAAELGDAVTLVEGDPELGGQVRLLAQLPGREEYGLAIAWRRKELARLGVDVRAGGGPATADDIAALEPDLVVVATGSDPPEAGEGVLSPADVIGGASTPAGAAVVIDEQGHHEAFGVAELLAHDGRDVTLVPVSGPAGAELEDAFALPIGLERLHTAGVKLLEGYAADDIGPGRVRLHGVYDGRARTLEAPLVVLAGRRTARGQLAPLLRSRGLAAVAVGDARAPRQVADAIREGHAAAATPALG